LKKTPIFCLSSIRRKSFFGQNLHLLAGFHLSAFTYPPDPAVVHKKQFPIEENSPDK
jgi:hypothetical protein